MFSKLINLTIGLLALVMFADTASARSLSHRSRIELGAGIRSHTDHVRTRISWDEVDVFTSTGVVGMVALSHWENENIAYVLSYTVHDIERETWVDHWGAEAHETSVVHSLMFGFRYYLPQSRPYSSMRPYLSAGVGPFIGTTEYGETDACDCEVYSEIDNMTVAGARLGGGVDVLLGRRVMLGFTGGYNFVEDFPRSIGGRRNYSGSEFGLSFSYLFGRGGH